MFYLCHKKKKRKKKKKEKPLNSEGKNNIQRNGIRDN